MIYVHETEHRVVKGASQYTLSDNADHPRLKDWRTFQHLLEAHSKGAALSSPLLEEVLICARRALYAAGGGSIVILDRECQESSHELVSGCPHKNTAYGYTGWDFCKDCGAEL